MRWFNYFSSIRGYGVKFYHYKRGINSNIESFTWEVAEVEDKELTLEVVGINPASTSADTKSCSQLKSSQK